MSDEEAELHGGGSGGDSSNEEGGSDPASSDEGKSDSHDEEGSSSDGDVTVSVSQVVVADPSPMKQLVGQSSKMSLRSEVAALSDDPDFVETGVPRPQFISGAVPKDSSSDGADEIDDDDDDYDDDEDGDDFGMADARKWDMMIRPDDKGDFFYEDSTNVPTIFIIFAVLNFVCGACVFILAAIPWVPSKYDWWWVLIGLPCCFGCCILGAILVVVTLFKWVTIRTTFSDHAECVIIAKRFRLLPFINSSERIPYEEIDEFVMYHVGENKAGARVFTRYIVYLRKNSGEDIPLTHLIKFERDARLLAMTLNESLISKLPV